MQLLKRLKETNGKGFFVKGFSDKVNYEKFKEPEECEEKFVAIITDLTISGHVIVSSASVNENGMWEIICESGEKFTLPQEPKNVRNMINGKLTVRVRTQYFFEMVNVPYDDYEEVSDEINKGTQGYHLVGTVNGNEVVTSTIVSFFKDNNGKWHGITKSGSHYTI